MKSIGNISWKREEKVKKKIFYIAAITLLVYLVGRVYLFAYKGRETSKENDKGSTKIQLKQEQLTNYLKYVPNDYLIDEENDVYATPKNVSDFDKNVLLGATIDYAYTSTNLAIPREDDISILTYDKLEITKLMKNLYNVSAEGVTQGKYKCNNFSLRNGNYEQSGGCGGGASIKTLSYIDGYEATEDTLIIYEYNVYYKAYIGTENTVLIKDMYTKKEEDLLDFCKDNKDYIAYETCARDYFEKYKLEFTKYKHIFKKENTDYYWFQTEVV